jgi:hypothetical protein
MNVSASPSRLPGKIAVWFACCGAASLLLATLVGASQPGTDSERGGASPYTPTKGEWLCLLLNSRQALANSQRVTGVVAARYVYDSSKPNTIRIEVLFGEGTSREQVQRCRVRAEHRAVEAAKAHGWQDWVKIEHEERKVTDMFASETFSK